ncbi:MAG: hypothetical protein ACYTG3_15200 [Planctomycetota bacterium]|jgi:hypothetical protein
MRAILVLVVAAACAGGPGRTDASRVSRFDEWFPSDTGLYLSIRDMPGLRARLARTTLWNDPALQKLLPAPVPSAGRLWEYVTGECAVGVLSADGGKAADVLLVCDVGDNGPRVRELLLQAQGGRRYALTRHRGVPVMVEVAPRDPQRRACWCLEGPRLAYSSDYGLMRRRLDREGEPLARQADYRRVRSRLGGGDAFGYVAFNLASPEVRRYAGGRMDALGLGTVRAVGAKFDLTEEGLTTQVRLLAPGPKRGVLKLADSGNRKLEPPALLPASTSTCLTFAVRWSAVWREFVRTGDALGQQATLAEVQIREATRAAGLDFDRDLLGSLGDEVTILERDRRVLLIEVRHRERLAKALDAVTAGAKVRKVMHKGVLVRAFSDGSLVALLDDTLLIAQSAADVRTLIERTEKGVRETEAYAAARAALPKRCILFWFFNPGAPRRTEEGLAALARRHATTGGGAVRNVGDGLEATFFVGLRPVAPVTRVVSAR